MLVEILSIIGIKQSRPECSLNTTYLVNIEIACTWQRLSSWRANARRRALKPKTDVGDCHNRFSLLIRGTRLASRWKSRRERERERATSLSKAVTARRKRQWPVQNAVGVTGLLHGNQGKAQTIQVAGFHRRLASLNLSLPSLSLSPSRRPFSSRSSAPVFSPSIDSLPRRHFRSSRREFSFFIVSVSFRAFRTVYKVEALNWKPWLCRRYCGFFFPPTLFRPVSVCVYVCCVPLPFFPTSSLLLFLFLQREGPLLLDRRLDVARTGNPYSWHSVQIYWTRPVPEAVVLSRRLQLNLKSRKTSLF